MLLQIMNIENNWLFEIVNNQQVPFIYSNKFDMFKYLHY